MFSPDNDAHNAVLLSLAAFLLAVPAFFVSLWAVIISRTVARRTTEPILTLRILSPAYMGHIDIQNSGTVPATGIRIELIEKRRRPSASLHVNETLAIDESCTILAWSFPEELNDEFRDQHPFGDATIDIQNIQRSLNNQQTLAYPDDQMAFHLLTRRGGQRIIVSCAIPDRPRQQRIYKVRNLESANPEFQMCSTFLVRIRANYLRFRFKKNAVLRPAPELPEFLKIDSEEP
jgi:hypothetical protein